MAGTTAEILTGGAVLAAAVAFLFHAGQATGFGGTAESYAVIASFRSVEGVQPGSDVRLAGVRIGRVESLTLNPATFFADAELSVRKDIALPVDSAVLISSEGLLGGNFVEILPGGALDNIEPGGEDDLAVQADFVRDPR